jgi:hypothetical protein
MSTAALTLNAWSLEYQSYKTIASAEHARLQVAKNQHLSTPKVVRVAAQLFLWPAFHAVTSNLEKLVELLEKMEACPSSVLLEDETVTIPSSLNDLFRKMCAVIQHIESADLHDGFFLKHYIDKWRVLSQQINGFAVRYEDAQNKLRSRVPADQVSNYQESFAAYGHCGPKPEQADDDDVKSELLHF